MKRIAAITALAAFGLAPTLGWATCSGDHDDSAASAAPPARLASTPAPAASKVPASAAKSTALVRAPAKPVAVKAKTPVPEGKMVATSAN